MGETIPSWDLVIPGHLPSAQIKDVLLCIEVSVLTNGTQGGCPRTEALGVGFPWREPLFLDMDVHLGSGDLGSDPSPALCPGSVGAGRWGWGYLPVGQGFCEDPMKELDTRKVA